MDIHSTRHRYHGGTTNNKAIMDEMFKAWLVVTVLAKTRRKFNGIVSSLLLSARAKIDEKWSATNNVPCVCSTGSVTVIYKRTVTSGGSVNDCAEVCITTHSCLE